MKKIEPYAVHEAIPPKAEPDDWVAIDLEIFGGVKGKLHRPIGQFASLAVTYDGQTAFVITDPADLDRTMERIQDATLIIQNAAFDIPQLRRWTKLAVTDRLWDTMLIERIIWNGYYDEANLAAMARRYLGIYMEKGIVKDFEKATFATMEMLTYNAIDALATWQIAQKQRELAKDSHKRVWYDIDLPALWAFLDFKGPKMDTKRWEEIAKENDEKATALRREFPFNPNAPAQVKEYLNRELKLKVSDTQDDTLSRHTKKHQMVRDILDYRKFQTRASRYGMNWLANHVESDSRVYPSYIVIGAETGRVATKDPTIQNIPVRDTPVYRECFVAEDGYVLVGGDYSQQEVRAAAYLSDDQVLIGLLRSKQDIYAGVATIAYGHTVKKEDPERNPTKKVVLGLIYGMSEYGLAADLDILVEEAAELMVKIMSPFPQLQRYLADQEKKEKYVKTAYGRKCWLNPYNSQVLRNARNSPCQGTGADMIKMATGLLHQRWDTQLETFPAILQIHDELDLEVRIENMEYAKKILRECMMDAGERIIPGVPTEVDIKTGCSWGEIH